ncbi:MAG: FAD-binding protein [Rhodospirillales bacterium]|nr:FAD-binding protein [Rhodospirillales bacterium]MBO6788616.1 FAD-binding protein [Rhodospirillales bacterium]
MPRDDYGLRATGRIGDEKLAKRIDKAVSGRVLFDPFSRGRYATDASFYQIEPVGVVVPETADDVRAVIDIARDEGMPVLPRGGGTSQCGQTVGEAIVLDTSKFMNNVLEFDASSRTARVEPGIVLDRLNAYLKPHGLWFPVDVSTSSRATIGGMTGNNSCGSRSIRYGTMRDNVRAIDAVLADGADMHFGEVSDNQTMAHLSDTQRDLVAKLLGIGRDNEELIKARFPDLMRRVGGYNIDALMPAGPARGGWDNQTVHQSAALPNLAHLLIGSEGTLAFSTSVDIDLQPLPKHKTLGVCHFPKFYDAMDAAQHLVKLGPVAVELVDRTMIELSRAIPIFTYTVNRFIKGEPDAVLLVEFAEPDPEENLKRLRQLGELMGDLGFPDAVVEAIDPEFQKAIWEVRKSGLNIMMSMKGDGKPISFIEDCAVQLEDLAEYTDRLTQVFHKHGTEGTWYAHASVGTLHVRPVVNLKQEMGAKQMRAIAEEAFEMVREYKGSHSGEHGDGLVRSEFHEPMFGKEMVAAFRNVKQAFDEDGLFNPGKIVDPPKMDDRSLFRFKPGYQPIEIETAMDWSDWGGFSGAVEMCNNNGACRKPDPGVMCPSFRVTGDEQHLTRGRANTLRLAISGQLGAEAFTSDAMKDTMQLCVGCKGCKRECPTGIDMAKMKVEFLYHYNKRHGVSLKDKLIAYLPRYAPMASKMAGVLNLRDTVPGLAKLSEWLLGFSAKRTLPKWRWDIFEAGSAGVHPESCPVGQAVVLFADTFSTYFEPENLHAAKRVLDAAGYRVVVAKPNAGERPLCCGRTFLAAGLVDEAKAEARRMADAVLPFVMAGVPIIGLEPSCLFTLRDEFSSLLPKDEAEVIARHAMLFEEFIASEIDAGTFRLDLQPLMQGKALLHGHCHQKAFATMGAVEKALGFVPGLKVETVESSCCGMAGAFGYEAANYETSIKMAELSLLPKVRETDKDTIVVADGTSCRHQIADGAARDAVHVARVLDMALATKEDAA